MAILSLIFASKFADMHKWMQLIISIPTLTFKKIYFKVSFWFQSKSKKNYHVY